MKVWGFVLLAAVANCGGSGLPTRTLQVGGVPLKVEVAATADTRAKGLMHRDSLGAERGMLFVYPDDRIRRFWMKDTRIPLSIAFVDRNGVIKKIADMKPLSEDRTSSVYPVRYAIEVNQGWFADKGIAEGSTVSGLDGVGER